MLPADVADNDLELSLVWVAVATVLVFLMQAGFMFLEIGFSRMKNAGTGVGKIFINLAIVSHRLVGDRIRHLGVR